MCVPLHGSRQLDCDRARVAPTCCAEGEGYSPQAANPAPEPSMCAMSRSYSSNCGQARSLVNLACCALLDTPTFAAHPVVLVLHVLVGNLFATSEMILVSADRLDFGNVEEVAGHSRTSVRCYSHE